jgi:hypothetical protein
VTWTPTLADECASSTSAGSSATAKLGAELVGAGAAKPREAIALITSTPGWACFATAAQAGLACVRDGPT